MNLVRCKDQKQITLCELIQDPREAAELAFSAMEWSEGWK